MLLINSNLGEHRPSCSEIAINPDMSSSAKIQTFYHEVMHHINSQYKLGLGEDDIDRLANGWAEFMQKGLGIELDWSDIK
jgi:hypothetical protein